MSRCLSPQSSWLSRTVLHQRLVSRSSLSSISTPDSLSSHRSASRFSLKIARFLFSKRRIKHETSSAAVPLSTQGHDPKSKTNDEMTELARSFLLSLEPEHRRALRDQLTEVETLSSTSTSNNVEVQWSQLAVVFFETGLPYIGFGFVDNFVMLVAGETIETFFGAAFCLSTMAAAGLGNAVSDVMGIGYVNECQLTACLADRIERTCGRFLAVFGIDTPRLTKAQWRLKKVHNTQLMAKVICIFVGCLLGMCPLLFRDTSSNKGKSTDKDKD